MVLATLTALFAVAPAAQEEPFLYVLGIAQDAGAPQAGGYAHPGWENPALRRRAVSIGLVDPVDNACWVFDASPDFREQLYTLQKKAVEDATLDLSGIFITHAHMGHYTGLMHLGHESMGASKVPVFTMPRMGDFLRENGPWSQLVNYENIELKELGNDRTVQLNERLSVTPFLVPHRQEFSEVVGYLIKGPTKSALYIPDIDSWEEWDELGVLVETMLREVDYAFFDGTFYANGEIPGRDMSGFPHPFIAHTMDRLDPLPDSEKAKVHFIHMNHTNPVMLPDSKERATVKEKGFRVAEEGGRYDLS